MNVYRAASAPQRANLTWHETWEGPDKGLIKCWEIGRSLITKCPEIAEKCTLGALPELGWKGGVSRTLKKREKYGALFYLAQWQGLRGEDLDIDPTEERTITCSQTGMIVTFTPDHSKYANQKAEADEGGKPLGRPTPGVPEQPLFP